MNLYFRLLFVVLKSLFGQRIAPLETSVLRFRVLPTDLDLNMHMNNGRYLTLMDLGRIDLMVRTGMGRLVMRQKWMPVIASALVRFRRSLLPFQVSELHTRLLCWNEKWFFIEQRVVRDGRTVTIGLVKGLIRRSGGFVSPDEVFAQVFGEPRESPPMPEAVRMWLASEEHVTAED
jgi:acyl-CoA thioesterase FadM